MPNIDPKTVKLIGQAIAAGAALVSKESGGLIKVEEAAKDFAKAITSQLQRGGAKITDAELHQIANDGRSNAQAVIDKLRNT